MIIPVFVNLFGPNQFPGSLSQAVGSTYGWVGSALTASTKAFKFALANYPDVVDATFRAVWTTENISSWIRLVHCDDGPVNITQITEIQGNGSLNPANQVVDITTSLHNLIVGGINKNLGFQLKDDGTNAWRIYEVRLEMNFEV